jgi:hypothetical protein
MDIKHNPFTPGIVMTAPGGLDYLKMPMGLMQVVSLQYQLVVQIEAKYMKRGHKKGTTPPPWVKRLRRIC